MTPAPNPDDGAKVDVEAAWAQIVLHWDDDFAAGPEAGDGQQLVTPGTPEAQGTPGEGSGQPAAPGSDLVPPTGLPPAGVPPAGAGDPARLARREDRRANRGRTDAEGPPGAPPISPLTPDAGASSMPPVEGRPEPEVPPAAGDQQSPRDPARPVPAADAGPEGVRPAGPRDWEEPLDEEGFVPAEPPPLPRGDLLSRLAWGGVLGAPLFLLLAALFWRTAPSLLVAAAVTAFVLGFGTLVVRMPDRRPEDGDDGAVV